MAAGNSASTQPSTSVISQRPLSVEMRVSAPMTSAATAHCHNGARRIASTAKATIDRIKSAQTMHVLLDQGRGAPSMKRDDHPLPNAPGPTLVADSYARAGTIATK